MVIIHPSKQNNQGNEEMETVISKINRHGTDNEQDLLAKVAEICKAAGVKFTTRRSQSISHTAFTFTVQKDGCKDQVMIVL